MKWTITIKPVNASLNQWVWMAVRDDQETVLSSDQLYATSGAAQSGAQLRIEAFEENEMIVREATLTVDFTPGEQP